MANVIITMKDGTKREFIERGRAGGSWGNSVTYEGAFVIIKDEWEAKTAIPAADVKEVHIASTARGW